ncbi:LANO_0B04434g1_1 [Lachancea nothofagi CBS 11611]|uniref:LANO_0B04434g1_1 n=1 Tax=Lachancea nothofagi CBS 11611 TaxID=1266666 RepID=A0A1G4IXR4_9SACH|nr:LANO_0B04434g1_1 [Lachancea nothofagi CBS 11611]
MYRDSYFQGHHMHEMHHALYLDWNHDIFMSPDHTATNGLRTENASLPINPFWDYFHDDDDWDRFHPLQVDCNGQLTAMPPLVESPMALGSIFAPRRTELGVWRDAGLDEFKQT